MRPNRWPNRKDHLIRLEIRSEIWTKSLAQQKRSSDNISFGSLNFDNISLILKANQIGSSKSDFNCIYLALSSVNQIDSSKSEFSWLLFDLIFSPFIKTNLQNKTLRQGISGIYYKIDVRM